MRSCRLWGSAHLKVNRKSRLASALCHPHLVVSEPCSESLVPALDLRCSCPTEPAYSTSEQPRQSTLTNQTQPETRQPASPSPHCVNHGAIASTSPFCISWGCADQSRARPGHRPLLRSLRSDTRHLWILCGYRPFDLLALVDLDSSYSPQTLHASGHQSTTPL